MLVFELCSRFIMSHTITGDIMQATQSVLIYAMNGPILPEQ